MKPHTFALLDIDTQNDFMIPEGKLYVPGANLLKETLVALIQAAAAQHIPILSSVDAHPADDPEFAQFPPHCVIGTTGQQKIAGTRLNDAVTLPQRALTTTERRRALQAPQVILKKNVFDVFSNPNTEILLERIAPDTVMVCGVATDYCVNAAVQGLLDRGYSVWLIEDAVAGVNPQQSQYTLNTFKTQGVKMTNANDVMMKWNTKEPVQ